MAKIIKVGSQNITPNKIANPFRTSRNSHTNPFKYNNFDGNTLPFELAADVFNGTKTQNTSKLRMIASSVTGSMNRMKSAFEPIVNFVNRIGGYASSAWNYAKETSFTAAMSDAASSTAIAFKGATNAIKGTNAYKTMADVLATEIHLPKIKGMTELKDGIVSGMEFLNRDVVDIGKDIHSQWNALIAKIPTRTHYSANMSVAELETALREELALGGAI